MPNTVAYTTCFGTGKPRCVKYDFSEKRTRNNKAKYFHMDYRYLDFDGKVFGGVQFKIFMKKFRGAKQINTLEVFPLQYYLSESEARAQLVEYS